MNTKFLPVASRHIFPKLGILCAFLSLAAAPSLSAYIVDFSQYAAGRIIDSEYATRGSDSTASALPRGAGFTVSVKATGNHPNIGVLYDTNKTGGWDPDLEGGNRGRLYEGGNLKGQAQGKVLIIQDRATQSEINTGSLKYASGTYSGYGGNSPNDSADGGTITFKFEQQLTSFGFDWIDLDSQEDASISFINTLTGASATLAFSEFTNKKSDFYRHGVSFGDHTANRISNIDLSFLSGSSDVAWSGNRNTQTFDQVRFNINGSGGVSSINFVPVPEPGTIVAGLLLGIMAGVTGYRRFKTKKSAGTTA